MPSVVGVRFRRAGRIYYFDAAGMDLAVDDRVIVETERGRQVGRVVIAPKQVLESELTAPLKSVLRRAEADDLQQMEHYRGQEEEALERCRQKVAAHKLPMKVLRAEYNYDGSRLTFYFTAEGRVDFRELLRDLAATFRTRIELRQVGAREAASLIGGMGVCGRPVCCATVFSTFPPISLQMAKNQDLAPNPEKLTGLCGRLLCCLRFENEAYSVLKGELPNVGARVSTSLGPGRVVGVEALKRRVGVELESGETVWLAAEGVGGPNGSPCPDCGGCS